jgi:uncharacterized membrane protein YfcA
MILILGVILIIAGALVFQYLGPEPIVRFAGALLVLVGIVLVIIGVLDVADVQFSSVQLADEGEEVLRSSWGAIFLFR